MKKLPPLLICIFLCGLLHAQKNKTSEEAAVQKTIRNVFEALSNRDSTALKSFCTRDALFIEYGTEWNTDTLIRKAIIQNKATDFRRINTLEFITTDVKDGVAWVLYRNKAQIAGNGKTVALFWIETVVLMKVEKEWKIKLLHSTLIKRE